jgi:hypothetical protein
MLDFGTSRYISPLPHPGVSSPFDRHTRHGNRFQTRGHEALSSPLPHLVRVILDRHGRHGDAFRTRGHEAQGRVSVGREHTTRHVASLAQGQPLVGDSAAHGRVEAFLERVEGVGG